MEYSFIIAVVVSFVIGLLGGRFLKIQKYIGLLKEAGDVLVAFGKAFADADLSPAEVDEIYAEAKELIDKIKNL